MLQLQPLRQRDAVRLEGEREGGELGLNVLLGQILGTEQFVSVSAGQLQIVRPHVMLVTIGSIQIPPTWFVYNSLAPGYRVTAELFKYK